MVPATHGPIQTGKTKLKNDINGRITSGYQIISLKISVWGRLVLVGLVLTNQPTCSSLSSSKSLSSLAIFVVSTLLLRGDYLYLDLCFHVPLFFFFMGCIVFQLPLLYHAFYDFLQLNIIFFVIATTLI